jgi:thioredoxin-related protein
MMISKNFIGLINIVLCILFINGNSFAGSKDAENKKINWLSFEDAVKLSKENPKKMFIDVYTDWCTWCKIMDRKTFTDPIIIDYINKSYHAVKFDGEGKDPVQFKGKMYRFVESEGRGHHELAAHLLKGKLLYPSYAILDEKLDALEPIRGFKEPPHMDMYLKYFGENHYKNIGYYKFRENYKSPYGWVDLRIRIPTH